MRHSNKFPLFFMIISLVCIMGCNSKSEVNTFIKSTQTKLNSTPEMPSTPTSTLTATVEPQSTLSACPSSLNTQTIVTKIPPSNSYIGLVLRNTSEDFEGGFIKYGYSFFWREKYGLVLIFYKDNYTYLLEEFICENNSGMYFKVIDELKIPSLAENESVLASCNFGAESTDVIMIAIGHNLDNDKQKTIVTRAWQVDFEKEIFVELSGNQINELSCK